MKAAPHAFAKPCAGAALAAVVAPLAAQAQQAPDLARYDCALSDGGSVAGDRLLADGFRIVSVGRFGASPNVMLADPGSTRRANCFARQEPRQVDRQEGRN